ncbi:MAG: hypothetical protein AAGA33_04645 [Pseudomonadota bacterium]
MAMMTRETARRVAADLMKPSADRLDQRKQRLAARNRQANRPASLLVPSVVAAVATALTISYLDVHPLAAIVFGATMGWSLGGPWSRR